MNTLIFGQGLGKRQTIINRAVSDMANSRGFLLLDPHGYTATQILTRVPKHRINDVILIDPTDSEYPIGWNPLSYVDNHPLAVSLIKDTIKAIWHYQNMSTPVMDRMLYNSLSALLNIKDATLLHLEPLLVNRTRDVLNVLNDPVQLWKWHQWLKKKPRDWALLTSSTENKAGEFSEDPRIRNILAQRGFDLKKAINSRKIIILKLPASELGDKTRMFGSLFLATLASTKTLPLTYPKYIIDAEYFDTPVLQTILSTMPDVTVLFRYLNQVSTELRYSVLGNCGERIIFRCGIDDSLFFHRTLPENNTLPKLHELDDYDAYHFMPSEFSKVRRFAVPDLPEPTRNFSKVVAQSRRRYSSRREAVEKVIRSIYRENGGGNNASDD